MLFSFRISRKLPVLYSFMIWSVRCGKRRQKRGSGKQSLTSAGDTVQGHREKQQGGQEVGDRSERRS